MGTEIQGLEEADKLSRLRVRIFNEIEHEELLEKKQQLGKNKGPDWKDKNEMMSWLKTTKYYKNLKNTDIKDFRSKVDASISTLINYIHNKNKSFQFFDILKMGFKQDKVGVVASIQPDLDLDLESLEDLETCSFYDAITLEEEQASIPVLLLHITDLIERYWVNGNYAKFRRVAECPLFVDIEKSIGHVFSRDTVKQLFHVG